MDAAAAAVQVGLLTASTVTPGLSADELALLVAAARLADPDGLIPDDLAGWSTATTYPTGFQVVPTPRNGHVYTATVGGISAAGQPAWPTSSAATVTDGTVTWTEAGAAWTPTYDLNAAAASGWRLKAGKASGLLDVTADGASFKSSRIAAACLEMSRVYARRAGGGGIGEVKTGTPSVPKPGRVLRRAPWPAGLAGGAGVDDGRLDPEEYPTRDVFAAAIGLRAEDLP